MNNERELACTIAKELQSRGHTAMLVGGCVRDELLGLVPKDYDVATSALPDEIEAIFPKTLGLGKSFGVVVVVDGCEMVEVATLRNDGLYSDGRRPEDVRFVTSLKDDASRRDFTINAMFKDPITDEVIDYFGGKEDLAKGIIRAVGDPHKRIGEDRLRMKRAIRFAARYGFSLDDGLYTAIRDHAPELGRVSIERQRDELRHILVSNDPLRGLDLMMESGLMNVVLPEVVELTGERAEQDPVFHPEGNVWVHTRMVLRQLIGSSFELMFGALLHDVGKPATQERYGDGRISNHAHDAVGARISNDICRRLRLSNHQTLQVYELVRLHMLMHQVDNIKLSKLIRLLEHDDIENLIELQHADSVGTTSPERFAKSRKLFLTEKLQALEEAAETQRVGSPPIVNGDILIRLGFKPGPLFKTILAEALDAQREGAFDEPVAGEQWVMENFGTVQSEGRIAKN